MHQVGKKKERKKERKKKKERKSINPLNINTFNNYYNTMNECDNIRMMLMTNCMGWKLKGPYNMKCYIKKLYYIIFCLN